jgi:putative SOS response-associated peptidase YedK
MCNRICLARDIDEIGRHFGVAGSKLRPKPHWNIAAGAMMPVLRREGVRRLDMMRWGLVTAWAENIRVVRTSFTGDGGELASRLRRRCLVPVENFYEWRPADRQPFAVALKDRQLMALAAIWDFWISPRGEQQPCFALITTPAHAVLAPLCAQMPVLVPPAGWELWLDPDADRAQLSGLLRAQPGELEIWPVDRSISNIRNDDPALLIPRELRNIGSLTREP